MTQPKRQPAVLLQAARLPTFLAVHIEEGDEAPALLFTPASMRWGRESWLLDLSSCRRYWLSQSCWRRMEIEQLFQHLLQHHAADRPYRAVLAHHPWKAVLLLEYMQKRQLTGLINHSEPFATALCKQVSWDFWIAAALEYGEQCQAMGLRGFNRALFRRQLQQMQGAMRRLSQPGPYAMAQASPAAMRRRYGPHVALLWEWTHAEEGDQEKRQPGLFDASTEIFDIGFPWRAWTAPVKPTVKRHLDYSVWQWDHIEPLLIEDFDRLCRADGWSSGEAVVHLRWTLMFEDTSRHEVDVCFRYPHKLHDELGTHATARIQAGHAFAAQYRPTHGDDDLHAPGLISGWEWEVAGKMRRLECSSALFDDGQARDPHADRCLRLENQLSVPVERFGLEADWVPEHSFSVQTERDSQDPNKGPWLALAKQRPLYVYREPIALAASERSRRTLFLERTAVKWWSGQGASSSERDYFILEDFAGKWRWGYKDAVDRWYVHGVFA